MDRKTLKYMEERAAKAREIVEKVDELTKTADRIIGTEQIRFSDRHGNVWSILRGFSSRESTNQYRLVSAINKAIVEMIAHEIQQLEQELAEL